MSEVQTFFLKILCRCTKPIRLRVIQRKEGALLLNATQNAPHSETHNNGSTTRAEIQSLTTPSFTCSQGLSSESAQLHIILNWLKTTWTKSKEESTIYRWYSDFPEAERYLNIFLNVFRRREWSHSAISILSKTKPGSIWKVHYETHPPPK